MTKKRVTNAYSEMPTELIKSNLDFKNELEDRIVLGKKIYSEISPIGSQTSAYYRWNDYNLELLKQSFSNTNNDYFREYKNCGEPYIPPIMVISTIGDSEDDFKTPVQLHQEFLQKFNHKIDYLERLVDKVNLLKSQVVSNKGENVNNISIKEDEIFIVHGQDNSAKLEVARFIEKLGLKPIILHEQASSGKTIIEKIEEYSNVGFGIVIYTPCDIGYRAGNDVDKKSRARQNVVFEHGYLIGKIGRRNVCALVKDEVETPNDISGVVYISMKGDWQFSIAKELRNSGYKIDMNRL